MNNQISHEKVLISVALILCACIIGYNAFFVPEISIPTVVYVDNNSSESSDETLEDEEYTPSAESTVNKADTNSETESKVSGKINLNTASAEELIDGLPRVGEVIANRIIEYRESHGGFSSIEELMNVQGIGEKTFENMKELICV